MTARAKPIALVITCEHGGNRVPSTYRSCFAKLRKLLDSHHGYDRGALRMAHELAARFDAPLFYSIVSRLLVDLNRSPGHQRLHAPAVRHLPADTRQVICARYYQPFRSAAENAMAVKIGRGRRVVHVSSHSFTPELDGEVRTADVGLLYDPRRRAELELCKTWQAALTARIPTLRVRRNYPYRGVSDGFAAFLRRRFAPKDYVGIELEINQRFALRGGKEWNAVRQAVAESLAEALGRTLD
ncbi:MAG TPA: N-formylglutamate amidohydrolase [Rhodocyclaceae bacterium]